MLVTSPGAKLYGLNGGFTRRRKGAMRVITVSVSDRTFNYVHRKKEGRKYGIGKVVDQLVAAEEAREEMRRELARLQQPTTQQSWQETGICVD